MFEYVLVKNGTQHFPYRRHRRLCNAYPMLRTVRLADGSDGGPLGNPYRLALRTFGQGMKGATILPI